MFQSGSDREERDRETTIIGMSRLRHVTVPSSVSVTPDTKKYCSPPLVFLIVKVEKEYYTMSEPNKNDFIAKEFTQIYL
jgi:hypothetical protein